MSDDPEPAKPAAEQGPRIAGIAVHGVADQHPGEIAVAITILLAHPDRPPDAVDDRRVPA